MDKKVRPRYVRFTDKEISAVSDMIDLISGSLTREAQAAVNKIFVSYWQDDVYQVCAHCGKKLKVKMIYPADYPKSTIQRRGS